MSVLVAQLLKIAHNIHGVGCGISGSAMVSGGNLMNRDLMPGDKVRVLQIGGVTKTRAQMNGVMCHLLAI